MNAASFDPLAKQDIAAPQVPALDVRGLSVDIATSRGVLNAVRGIDLKIRSGETLALVGESGCGKSTVAKAITGLHAITDGSAHICGHEVTALSRRQWRPLRALVQMIFQDPFASLNPRKRIGSILSETMRVNGMPKQQAMQRSAELLERVGLPKTALRSFPHEFSGGQRQRIGIARALALQPRLIVCDEPVSALDVSVQGQIVNLLMDLQKTENVAYLFISHDLSVVQQISDQIAVMYLGRIVEAGSREEIWSAPKHPYTRALIDSVPSLDRRRKDLSLRPYLAGDLPSPYNPPSGCAFRTRCAKAQAICSDIRPELQSAGSKHLVACHFSD